MPRGTARVVLKHRGHVVGQYMAHCGERAFPVSGRMFGERLCSKPGRTLNATGSPVSPWDLAGGPSPARRGRRPSWGRPGAFPGMLSAGPLAALAA